MAGQFPTGPAEFNVKIDVDAARRLFSGSPVPIVFSGYEIGQKILYPASSIEKDFAYVPHHPIADAYRAYKKMPYDRQTWDLTAVLYAVRPKSFGLSVKGRVAVDDKGVTTFKEDNSGLDQYLTATPEQCAKALQQMIELATRRPGLK
jgi:inosine-uridine nucleoside N-ribohydrolase